VADIIIDGTIGANRLLILDSTGKIPAVDGSQVTTIAAGNIATGTIPIARIDTGSIANKIVVLDGSGRLPAVSAALITNLSSSTKSASDPTISTNPSGGVGTEWHNTTSGEVYICTDATAGANTWTNIGDGSGDVMPYVFQGAIAGYTGSHDRIDRISFTSDGAATDVGDMATGSNNKGRYGAAGNSSLTHAYFSGGYGPGQYSPNTADVIEAMSFASKGTAVDVGNLVIHMRNQASSSNQTYAYLHCGLRAANDPSGAAGSYNVIWRFQMVTSADATDVGDLYNGVTARAGGHSDPPNAYGYSSGGGAYNASSHYNIIQRYAMVSSGNSTDVGDLFLALQQHGSTSSATHGYKAGSYEGLMSNVIEKFAYGSSSNATDVSNLLANYHGPTGVSSTGFGYSVGGGTSPSVAVTTTIEKYSYSADVDATDVGDLTAAAGQMGTCGAQE